MKTGWFVVPSKTERDMYFSAKTPAIKYAFREKRDKVFNPEGKCIWNFKR